MLRRVLIVDDDSMYREILGRIARSLDLDATEAADVNAAIEVLRARDFDVILLDLRLGGDTDGGQVLEFLRRTKRHLLPRVLCVTGSPEMINKVALDVPCIDKGNLDTLGEKIRSLL